MTTPKDKPFIGCPAIYKTAEEFDEAADAYFNSDFAWANGSDGEKFFAPTMSGLAMALGMDRRSLVNYSNKEEFFPTIKKARAIVEQAQEQRLYGNNVTGMIFSLKNNFGWADKNEIAHTSPDGSMSPNKIELVAPGLNDHGED